MIQRIRRLGIGQMAKVMGVLYFMIGILFAAIMGLFGSMFPSTGEENVAIFGGVMLIALPIIYGVFGFLAGALMAWLYNIVAGFTGGLELEMDSAEYERM
ncbi:MAG TPA: hypothetical protein VFT04_04450 [Gemmatimonadales bacterium]|nr:hypothetical protein [Gemmatimonadales bacterium]